VQLDVATPHVGAGLRVWHTWLHGGSHVFEESQFQRARQAVTDAVAPRHHPLAKALAVQAVAVAKDPACCSYGTRYTYTLRHNKIVPRYVYMYAVRTHGLD
jgi:hypothetical protein